VFPKQSAYRHAVVQTVSYLDPMKDGRGEVKASVDLTANMRGDFKVLPGGWR
jgi:hypothetical protein